LGIQIENNTTGTIDEVPSTSQVREKWRQATFSCKCLTNHGQQVHGERAFCSQCSFLIFHRNIPDVRQCPGCLINESWEVLGQSCLACRCATLVYRNRFHQRYQQYLDQWLPITETDTDTDDNGNDTDSVQKPPPPSQFTTLDSQKELYRLRNQSIEDSFREIKSRSSSQQTKYIFEDLSLLQKTIQDNAGTLKRNLNPSLSDRLTSEATSENQTNMRQDGSSPPRKKCAITKQLSTTENSDLMIDNTSCPLADTSSRPPLAPIDMNSWKNHAPRKVKYNHNTKRAAKNRARTKTAKGNKHNNFATNAYSSPETVKNMTNLTYGSREARIG
jgi:hypothetical protein